MGPSPQRISEFTTKRLRFCRLFGLPAPPARISIAPSETVSALLLLLADAALFACARGLLQHPRPGGAPSFGVIFASALGQVLWAAVGRPERRLRGLFANPDHFAAYLEIGLALAFGVLWAEVVTSRDRGLDVDGSIRTVRAPIPPLANSSPRVGSIAARDRTHRISRRNPRRRRDTFALLAVALARRRSRRRRRALIVATALLLGTSLAIGLTGHGRFSRFLLTDPRDLGSTTRVAIWKTSVDAWKEFPVVGSGLGTFREAFRRVQPSELRGLLEQAHDDFLQIAVTGGAVGAGLGVVLVLSLLVAMARRGSRQRHREESAPTLGGFGALLSLTLHGLIDFHLSIPIISATLACALGAAWAAASRP